MRHPDTLKLYIFRQIIIDELIPWLMDYIDSTGQCMCVVGVSQAGQQSVPDELKTDQYLFVNINLLMYIDMQTGWPYIWSLVCSAHLDTC